ncbi:MAG: hypothetical protein K8F91_07940, partial [Candidatus Obscuribacterales bacterium]|nr:hypothetical protein [Candidatus Obscuribacterales bacterium]
MNNIILPEQSVSLRELTENEDPTLEAMLSEYHIELSRAFPLEGEIESVETYLDYLADQESTWDIIVLRDEKQNIVGGIQYQTLDINGEIIKKAAWVEHIWVKLENRSYQNFRALLKVAKDAIAAQGASLIFMEFNNPDKMTAEEIAVDADSGITTQDREKIWGYVGIHVATTASGKIAAYGQPSMEGQPPVDYLSMGFVCDEPLAGKTIPTADYLKIAQTAHATIPGVDLTTDPTVLAYT